MHQTKSPDYPGRLSMIHISVVSTEVGQLQGP